MKTKLRILSTGKYSFLELNGKSMGKGVTSFSFSHEGSGDATLTLTLDLNTFEFMQDGTFDEASRKFIEANPPDDGLIERTVE